MMKQITAMITVFIFSLAGTVSTFAADIPKEMEAATNKYLQKENYDFKTGSLDVTNAKEFKVTSPEKGNESITIIAGLSEFQTVRDNIFTFDHRETVYFNPKDGKMLTSAEIGEFKNEKLLAYKDQFEHLGKQMNLGWILSLLALLVVVPGILLYTWGNQVYSSTRFQVKNNLYNQSQTYN